LHTEPCLCGRNTSRVGPVIGRKQHMIKYKGTTLYPPAMNDVLNDIVGIENYIIEISTNDLDTDEILIKIAVTNPTPVFLQELKDHFRAKLRVTPKIEFTTNEVLKPLIFNPNSRKPIRFFDNRKNVV
jgi:phenylacetate-CoA ligase